jgi:hypothetical protein
MLGVTPSTMKGGEFFEIEPPWTPESATPTARSG